MAPVHITSRMGTGCGDKRSMNVKVSPALHVERPSPSRPSSAGPIRMGQLTTKSHADDWMKGVLVAPGFAAS